MWFFYLFLCMHFISTVNAMETIKLNTTNNIILRGEINKESASKFIYDLNMLPNKNNTYLYLHTPGGSVVDGMKIVSEVKK